MAALDSTFARQPFESIQQLFPLAEKVVKLEAICFSCQREAAFSFRMSKDCDVQVGIPANGEYCHVSPPV